MDSISVDVGDSKVEVPVRWVHTLVLGSGAAGLNAAVQLVRHGVRDVAIVTEGLSMGTSINTGSDKQTYYKLALYGQAADAPVDMAGDYFAGGGMHGDLALVEASVSARAFLNLVNLGVPFPQDRHGQFIGYKTDHDPRGRATSIGPYTSREMCRALIAEVRRLGIPVYEQRTAAALIVAGEADARRAAGALVVDGRGDFELYAAENVVFAAGGPGGLYATSVYPKVHTGGIGLALLAGARAQGLPESQYGLASTKFRWNVSGTYMQVVPRFISTAEDGTGDEREFLREYFDAPGTMNSMIFLKGYQWPFHAAKIVGGSSIVDILVYIETVQKGRRVFLDFRRDAEDFRFDDLSGEAREYLEKSEALLASPIARLRKMNPGAVSLYADHGIDIAREPLEVAVCAQHNNGGLAANHWWESANIRRLFPVGEVNGTHGVARPGGSALNAGQVGGFRAAAYIANRCRGWSLDAAAFAPAAAADAREILRWCAASRDGGGRSWREERAELQGRMSAAGAHIRSAERLRRAADEARAQWRRVASSGCGVAGPGALRQAVTTRYLCFAHAVYLEAVLFAVESGAGSRGSAMVIDAEGTPAHDRLGEAWRFAPEDTAFREKVLETDIAGDGLTAHRYVPRRPVPTEAAWFETAWAAFRAGDIYDG